jgi:hypothetical protein
VTPTWIAALIALTAVTATYLSCLRPAVRRRAHRATADGAAAKLGIDRQITALSEEVHALRAQGATNRGPAPVRPGFRAGVGGRCSAATLGSSG